MWLLLLANFPAFSIAVQERSEMTEKNDRTSRKTSSIFIPIYILLTKSMIQVLDAYQEFNLMLTKSMILIQKLERYKQE
jgi:hypothetical protein